MEKARPEFPPNRVTDLIASKKAGSTVNCRVSFEILPVDFTHRDNPFRAYIFLCRYSGEVDGQGFSFRKCYARGCPHNLCPHVSQAVMIANRYLQRDYRRLEKGGITMEKHLFSLQDMIVKYDGAREEYGGVMAIHDYLNLAEEGNDVEIAVNLEYVPAVEHFANTQNAQTFMMANFAVECLGKTSHVERCLACYHEEKEAEDRRQKIRIANDRLKLLYADFDQAGIRYKERFFV
jgi:hypothetical protein